MTTIVVGVDGSAESRSALRWAIDEAKLRGAQVRAVHAWAYPAVPGRGIAPAVLAVPPDVLRQEAEEFLDTIVAEVAGESPEAHLVQVTVEGSAPKVLIEASRDADLLVVGSRGLGGFMGLLLGSVSQQCAHHAACPVVIVRAGDAAT